MRERKPRWQIIATIHDVQFTDEWSHWYASWAFGPTKANPTHTATTGVTMRLNASCCEMHSMSKTDGRQEQKGTETFFLLM